MVIVQIEKDHHSESETSTVALEELFALQDEIRADEKELKQLQQRAKQLQDERQQIEDERREIIQQRAVAELDLHDSDRQFTVDRIARDDLRQRLADINRAIDDTKARIIRQKAAFDSALAEEQRIRDEAAHTEERVNALYGKIGHGRLFASKADRDASLSSEIRDLSALIDQTRLQVADLSTHKASLSAQETSLRSRFDSYEQSVQAKTANLHKLSASCSSLRKDRDQAANLRKYVSSSFSCLSPRGSRLNPTITDSSGERTSRRRTRSET